jgi:hypothetical protein
MNLSSKSFEEIQKFFEEKIEALHSKYESLFIIDQNEISGEYVATIYKLHSVRSEWMKAKTALVKITRETQKLYTSLYTKAKEGRVIVTRPDGKEVSRTFSSEYEIKEWIYTNINYQKIKIFKDYQEIICEYFDKLLDSLASKLKVVSYLQNFDRVWK